MEKEGQIRVIWLAGERNQGDSDQGEFPTALGLTLSFQNPEFLAHIFLHWRKIYVGRQILTRGLLDELGIRAKEKEQSLGVFHLGHSEDQKRE